MTALEALQKVWTMAYHANDLGDAPWTDEEKEALNKVKTYIEITFPDQAPLPNRPLLDSGDAQPDCPTEGIAARQGNGA